MTNKRIQHLQNEKEFMLDFFIFCENIIHIPRYGQNNILQCCTRTDKRLTNSQTYNINKSSFSRHVDVKNFQRFNKTNH